MSELIVFAAFAYTGIALMVGAYAVIQMRKQALAFIAEMSDEELLNWYLEQKPCK